MNNSSNRKRSKPTIQKATYSLILGIISVILQPYWVSFYGIDLGSGLAFPLRMVIALICAIVGLNFGVQGLKSPRRKLAIAGIAICAISLLCWIYLFIASLIMGGPIYLWMKNGQ